MSLPFHLLAHLVEADIGESWLMDQFLDDNLDEEEEEDPDCVNDPLYKLDFKVRLYFEGVLVHI